MKSTDIIKLHSYQLKGYTIFCEGEEIVISVSTSEDMQAWERNADCKWPTFNLNGTEHFFDCYDPQDFQVKKIENIDWQK